MLLSLFAFLFTFVSPPDTVRTPGTVKHLPSRLELCPQTDTFTVAAIAFAGNRKTIDRVLRAELDFTEGEVVTEAGLNERLEQNRLRLLNLQLFHWVRYETVCVNGRLTLLFEVQERWYLFPVPIFSLADRNFNAWWEKKDFNRIDYGLHVMQYNFRGRNEQLRANFQFGFNRKFELFYSVPYINKKRNLGFNIGGSYYQSHYLDYATFRDKLVTIREEDRFSIQRYYVVGGITLRENVQRQKTISLSYHQEQISDTVFQLNPRFFNGNQRREYLSAEVSAVYNYRNTFAYPLAGHYLKIGLSTQYFLNDNNYNSGIFARFADYNPLGKGFYYSYCLEGSTTFGSAFSMADNAALGYGTYIRGYELYVIGGQAFGLLKQGISHRIFDVSEIKLKFIKNPKFNRIPLTLYINLFADAGYSYDKYFTESNFLVNRLNMATGVGIHFVTYYDKVVTVEYSLNREGERGLYFHSVFPF